MLTSTQFSKFVHNYSRRLQDMQDVLNYLDNRIGDGDHGTNMARGFHAAAAKVEQLDTTDLGKACSTIAMTLLSTVGGASGPLYGTVFMQLSSVWKGLSGIDNGRLYEALKKALDGVQARGKAVPGDKTMVDVWTPVLAYLSNVDVESDDVIRYAALVGQDAALKTRQMVAKKGRASYLGARSQGTLDPGSVSSAAFFEELFDAVAGGVQRASWQTSAL